MAAIRRLHQDKTIPPEIKAELPEVPPPAPRPSKPVVGAFRTGWTRETLEAKLKQKMSPSNRAFYEQKEMPQLGEPATVIDESAIDAGRAIADSCTAIRARTHAKYVIRKKVSGEVFDVYFRVIAEMLRMRFIERDGADFQLSESFLRLMPGMTLEEYRKKHRNKLEYLARLAHKRVSKILRED